MRAPFDSTILNTYDLSEERAKLQTLVSETLQKKYAEGEVIFAPFLISVPLHAIYQSLVKAQPLIVDDHRGVINHLVEILTIQQELSSSLTPLHQDMTTHIMNMGFGLLEQIIICLTKSDMPIADLLQDYNLIDELSRAMTNEHNSQDSIVVAVNDALANLLKKLNEGSLKIKIEEIESFWKQQTLNSVENYETFHNISVTCINSLNELLESTIQHSFDHMTQHIDGLVTQIKTFGSLLIKQDAEKQIFLINNDPWIKINEKKKLYCDLIPRIEMLCNAIPVLQLSENEQISYCKNLMAGFELTREASFLVQMECFSKVFCSQNINMMQHIAEYILSAKDSIINTSQTVSTTQTLKPALKRVHFSNENQIINSDAKPGVHYANEPTLKRQKSDSAGPSGQERSTNIDKFINILNPIEPKAHDMSRRFVAALLNHIVTSMSCLNTVNGTLKLFIKKDLLTHALHICPEDAADLYQELKEKMELLCNSQGTARAIKDMQRFSRPRENNMNIKDFSNQPHPIAAWFKAVLSDLVEQLDASISLEKSLNELIQQLIVRLFEVIQQDKDQRITADIMREMQVPFMDNNSPLVFTNMDAPIVITAKSSNKQAIQRPTPKLIHFGSLPDALIAANVEELNAWLEEKKRTKEPKQYLEFLIYKNISNFTALHSALHEETFKNFNNVSIYLREVKIMMHGQPNHCFKKFLMSQTSTGLTFLHLIAKKGNFEFLKSTAKDFKHELGETEYANALRIRTNYSFMPSCPREKTAASAINHFLDMEREQNSVLIPDRNGFFAQNDERRTNNSSTGLTLHVNK